MTAPPNWGPPPPPPPAPAPISKKRAALLAFFLGWLGVHNFYLNQRGRGLAHLQLFGLAMLTFVAVGLYTLFYIFWYSALYLGNSSDGTPELIITVLTVLAFGLLIVDVLWAIVEGILILARPTGPGAEAPR